jgi:hypothetical protein
MPVSSYEPNDSNPEMTDIQCMSYILALDDKATFTVLFGSADKVTGICSEEKTRTLA